MQTYSISFASGPDKGPFVVKTDHYVFGFKLHWFLITAENPLPEQLQVKGLVEEYNKGVYFVLHDSPKIKIELIND